MPKIQRSKRTSISSHVGTSAGNNRKQKSGSSSSVLESIQRAASLITGLVALAYVLGFIIVNSYLQLNYGFSNANLLNTRYIAAGLLFMSILITSVFYTHLLRRINLSVYGDFMRNSIVIYLPGILSTITWLCIIFLFGNKNLTKSIVSILFFLLWNIFISGIVNSIRIRNLRSLLTEGKARSFKEIRNSFMYIIYAILFCLSVPSIYSNAIFPIASPIIGGGLSSKVKFIGDKDKIEALRSLVRMESQYRTMTVDLIDQTDTTYLILAEYTDGNTQQPVIVQKDLVKGLMLIRDERSSSTVPLNTTPILNPTAIPITSTAPIQTPIITNTAGATKIQNSNPTSIPKVKP
jgi:hypothetical protein